MREKKFYMVFYQYDGGHWGYSGMKETIQRAEEYADELDRISKNIQIKEITLKV